jgi:motility quorum-sensing regulator/GCU-specific mRNA interferase toxin
LTKSPSKGNLPPSGPVITIRADGVKEKKVPHHDLSAVKALAANLGPAAFSKAALDGGRNMGLKTEEMLGVVASLTGSRFYKCMTSYHDDSIWQDVYHAGTPNYKVAYIKIILKQNAPVIQFKEK